jgi:hypothetical protein
MGQTRRVRPSRLTSLYRLYETAERYCTTDMVLLFWYVYWMAYEPE